MSRISPYGQFNAYPAAPRPRQNPAGMQAAPPSFGASGHTGASLAEATPASPTDSTIHSSPQNPPLQNSPPRPLGKPTLFSRVLGDRSRAALGIFFEDIVPPAMGFAFLAGPLGWVVTLGGLVMAPVSGAFGRYISRDVDHAKLPAHMKSLHDFKSALHNRENLKEGELVDKWNQLINDTLNIKVNRFQGLANFVLNKLKLSQTGYVGRILNNPNFLKAKMYSNMAHANSVGGVMKAGAKGGVSFWFYQFFLPGVGRFLEKASNVLPGPLKWPFKILGWLMDHFPTLKLAKDMAFPGKAAA